MISVNFPFIGGVGGPCKSKGSMEMLSSLIWGERLFSLDKKMERSSCLEVKTMGCSRDFKQSYAWSLEVIEGSGCIRGIMCDEVLVMPLSSSKGLSLDPSRGVVGILNPDIKELLLWIDHMSSSLCSEFQGFG